MSEFDKDLKNIDDDADDFNFDHDDDDFNFDQEEDSSSDTSSPVGVAAASAADALDDIDPVIAEAAPSENAAVSSIVPPEREPEHIPSARSSKNVKGSRISYEKKKQLYGYGFIGL